MKKIIFTDLDGTLLDALTYSFAPAKKALQLVEKKHIPLIICTSKTRAEIEYWRDKFHNHDPFISENGGGIFIPKEYFDFSFPHDAEEEKYFVIQLGTSYQKLTQLLDALKKTYDIRGFHDMTVEEVAKDSQLDESQARLAKEREFDEPFKIMDESQRDLILREITQHQLHYTEGGRYYHILGDNDKGKAVEILTNLFARKFGDICTIGLGDSENDFPMLEKVDRAYLVMKPNGKYASQKYENAKGIGPEGWNATVLKEVE